MFPLGLEILARFAEYAVKIKNFADLSETEKEAYVKRRISDAFLRWRPLAFAAAIFFPLPRQTTFFCEIVL